MGSISRSLEQIYAESNQLRAEKTAASRESYEDVLSYPDQLRELAEMMKNASYDVTIGDVVNVVSGFSSYVHSEKTAFVSPLKMQNGINQLETLGDIVHKPSMLPNSVRNTMDRAGDFLKRKANPGPYVDPDVAKYQADEAARLARTKKPTAVDNPAPAADQAAGPAPGTGAAADQAAGPAPGTGAADDAGEKITDTTGGWKLPTALGAAGVAGTGGAYYYADAKAKEDSKQQRNLAFGAGLASGVAAPQIAARAGGMLSRFGNQHSPGGGGQYGY